MAQKLEKAKIMTVRPPGEAFDVLFNPTEYRLSKSNQFAEVVIPGLTAPMLQFAYGNAQTLAMQLFFDTYDPQGSDPQVAYNGSGGRIEKDTDVRLYTRRVTDLLQLDADLHAPPICQFSWGNLNFVGVLQQADLRCTLFLPNGIPVRATVDVTFKQFYDGAKETGMLQSAHFYKSHRVLPRQTLPGIAAEHYGDPTQWKAIAAANRLDDPLRLRPGQVLIIPAIE